MRNSAVISCILGVTFMCHAPARAQTAVETFEFLTMGDAFSECGRGENTPLKSCKITKTDSSIVKEVLTSDDRAVTMTLKQNSECTYETDVDDKDGTLIKIYDFSGLYDFDYDEKFSVENDTGYHESGKHFMDDYYTVAGTLQGVKFSVTHNKEKPIERAELKLLALIKAQDHPKALNRFRAAMNYFKSNYCKGSAF